MFRKILLTGIIILGIINSLAAAAYTELMQLNNANQEKIKTVTAAGQISIVMRSDDGTPLVNQTVDVNIFMKKPDLFKVTMQQPAASTLVQKGDLLTRKIGNEPASTRKVESGSNLAKNYFGGIAIDSISENTISAQETAVLNGEEVTVFTIKIDYAYEPNTVPAARTSFKIDEAKVFINKKGMIVKQVMYRTDEALLRMEYHYVLKDDIFIADKITTKITYNTMNMETVISYSSISLNTPMSDKEFELR